jgi:quercetin dioxygenase-like cupin family protein
MNRRGIFTLGIWVLGSALGLGKRIAIGQQLPPTENKDVSVGKTASVDLGPEIAGMQGRQLRVRVVNVAPGGHIREHSHKDWPESVYVLQGGVTEHRGGKANDYRAGETFWGDQNTTHWLENKGTAPAMLMVADIFKLP